METDIITIQEKAVKVEKAVNEVNEKVFTALCTNCDERWVCKIRNNASVIWHCEEYK